MQAVYRIGVVGEYRESADTHRGTTDALHHAAAADGDECQVTWLGTTGLERHGVDLLARFDGLVVAPGSPYESTRGALDAIEWARTNDVPLLGTCGGFQHVVIEFARNVAGIDDAAHAELDPSASKLVISALTCSLAGQSFEVTLRDESVALRAYGTRQVTERYYCNFGLNPEYLDPLAQAGLVVSGVDGDGEPRIVELPGLAVLRRDAVRAADVEHARGTAPARASFRSCRRWGMIAPMAAVGIDEFAFLEETAAEAGLAWSGAPRVERQALEVGDGRTVSALVWGDAAPELVLLHGGAQNAHTWDTVALALDRPLAAFDLPGHGHSSWRVDGDYAPSTMAVDVTRAMEMLGVKGCVLVGMGLGGPVALRVAVDHPDLVRRLVLVDGASGVPPRPDEARASDAGAQVAEFTSHATFASFDELLDRTVRYNPRRSESSLRRGATHNSTQLPDATWTWRWDPAIKGAPIVDDPGRVDLTHDRLDAPVLVVRGELSDAVRDDSFAELEVLHPDSRLVTIEGAGHGVQGDRPVALAAVIRTEADS